ncbi:MAG: ABC transporter substrate-binding protein [Proteobacteria bacterium]|nr:ABC transporter substrate-binding protein [Pseudomonadota bacterium]
MKSLCIAAALVLIVCAPARAAPAVIVSSKLSSESALIGEMIGMILKGAGIPTVDRMRLGATPVVRRALLDGEIDLYVDYTGNGAIFFDMPSNPAWKSLRRGYQLGARLDLAKHRIVWLTPAPASDTWALAVRRDVAAKYHLRTMSDFARWVRAGGHVVLACSAEFANAGTLRSLERTYGFRLRSDQLIVLAGGETAAMIAAAAARTDGTNTAMVYSTDGGITAAKLIVLKDDRHVEPVYAPVPLLRAAVLREYPGIAALVKPLMESLDRETLQRLNERMQVDGEPLEAVARDYLRQKGLLK